MTASRKSDIEDISQPSEAQAFIRLSVPARDSEQS